MRTRVAAIVVTLIFLSSIGLAQTQTSISGTVRDSQGLPVARAAVTARDAATTVVIKTVTDGKGEYSFPSLQPGTYDLLAEAPGFERFLQKSLMLELGKVARLDLTMKVGQASAQVTVQSDAASLHSDDATLEYGYSPDVEIRLPIVINGGPRSATVFTALLPGVAANQGVNSTNSERINGGISEGQEAVMDGVSLQEGGLSQGGNIALADFPMSPDMISEVRVLTSNYEPQYGGTNSGVIIENTRSGAKQFHGSLYEYMRNTVLNAKPYGAANRFQDNENDFGGSIGGPVHVRGLFTPSNKTFFFFNYEAFRQAGGINTPTLTIPSLREQQGDFTDQINSATGQLIPIYDPATTTTDPVAGTVSRKQFMGCNGNQPNVICPTRIAGSAASQFFKYLPMPTNNGVLNNYRVPKAVPDEITAGANQFFGKIDEYIGNNDHVAASIWHQITPQKFNSNLPVALSYDQLFGDPESSWIDRVNWDHTFSPALLNHFAYGYLNRNEGEGSMNYKYADQLPQIPGVAGYSAPPEILLDGITQFGRADGAPSTHITNRPTNITNDLVTLVKGHHIISFGGEYRNLATNSTNSVNEAGTFEFGAAATGLPGQLSGATIASFLLGAVEQANTTFYSVNKYSAVQHAVALYGGDHWTVSKHLTADYGLRWGFYTPGRETSNQTSWLDLSHPNPSAANRPGSLVFASKNAGAAYAGGSYPEHTFYKAFQPRIGLVYSPNQQTVVRAGYGLFFDQLFYPGYALGTNQTGYNITPSFGSSGVANANPAFYLSGGFPSNHPSVPQFNGGQVNGQDSNAIAPWRAAIGGRTPYAQQWNFTVEQQVLNGIVSIAYTGNKGTRLYSSISPHNTLPLSLLPTLGQHLYDVFAPGQTMLDGVSAPYPGWSSQMKNCPADVAQALLPYPQFCSPLGLFTESDGWSNYDSLQVQAQKRYSNGLFFLVNYTWSKLLGTPGNIFGAVVQYYYFAPEQKNRYRALNDDDLPQIFNFASVYDLPFGKGRRWFHENNLLNAAIGGWELAGDFHSNSGNLMSFAAGCNAPTQMHAYGCFPGVVQGQPLLTTHNLKEPSTTSIFNLKALQGGNLTNPYQFGFTVPNGPRFTGVRGGSYADTDLSLAKRTTFGDRTTLIVSAAGANILNQHSLGTSFGDIIGIPDFGLWTGNVSNPRNIEVYARLEF